jgi:ATP-dependent helicase/nuclease subunit A
VEAWRELSRRNGPFGFFATLLGPRGGRSKLVARLGSEAADAIDAFLCFAHQSEIAETPSLTVFLNRFESASHSIKRDLDSVNNEVRVMTVHGAKGLEAPIVILIDGCEVLGRDPPLLQLVTGPAGRSRSGRRARTRIAPPWPRPANGFTPGATRSTTGCSTWP